MSCARVTIWLLLCVLFVHCEFLNKKFCDDADLSQCQIHHVVLDPCDDGGSFCTIRKSKRYILSVDFMPHFSAETLNITIYGDDSNVGSFDKAVRTPSDACGMLTCPLQEEIRRIFDIEFTLGKTFAMGKYPLQVKLFNRKNEKQACCFTFTVKVVK